MKTILIVCTAVSIWSCANCFVMKNQDVPILKQMLGSQATNNVGGQEQRTKRQAYQFSSGVEFFLPEIRFDSFNCANRTYGYYADTGNYCQLFHICLENGQQFSFFCPNQTIFDQRLLICEDEFMATPCEQAEQYYFVNQFFGVIDPETIAVQIKSSPV